MSVMNGLLTILVSMSKMFDGIGWVPFVVALLANTGHSEILTPPYFNLAEGRNITASATCGEDTEGPELYCKLVGANAENELHANVIQGQLCDHCDPTRPDKMHPPQFAVDGMETWWQSPPLSRGMKYNEVNLTIDLGQEFHVAYVYMRMGNSPRPGLWILEKSADYGKTFVPWQYFSDSESDCENYFGAQSLEPITQDDSVICTTEYSKIVPLEGGEIPIPLLKNRPSANYYFNSSVLQEWTRATNVRFRFLRTKNLLGHLMSVARQDPTVTRRYFYSIKDISIGGRCMCNGHADTCDIQDPNNTTVLLCRCQHNTCGAKCETCCKGFQQKAWRQSKSSSPFVCEPCNCFQHSNDCIYDEEVDKKYLSLDIHGNYAGGGVCQNCRDNTEGINCNKCKPTFYRPHDKHWNETDVCQSCDCNVFYSTGNCAEGTGKCECKKEFTSPNCNECSFGYYDYPNCKACECYLNGTESLQCRITDGECTCKYNYGGKYCKECADHYYNFPECQPCECNTLGSISSSCDQKTGNCTCKSNYGGKQCDECHHGYYSYPSCLYCNCDVVGTKAGICNKQSGECLCKEGYAGEWCDQCKPGYYGYPDCKPCNCTTVGSASSVCDATGKCRCAINFGGRTCEKCSVGYYKYPECLQCQCDGHGSNGISCDYEGHCQCKYNFDGNRCNQCHEGFYNFPICEECNCNPAGVVAAFAGCGSVPTGELCQCKERVQGRICNQCKPLYWNLHLNNPEGCEECRCNIPGVLGGNAVCNSESGQCVCKPSVIARSCSECVEGTYNLQENNLFGCTDCNCDIGGSISSLCDKVTGQCPCQSRVTGRTCKDPIKAHYFPTLYQYQYEIEDGYTPANTVIRYGYDENIFPDYSWKAYAVFSLLQNEILQDVFIQKPTLYRIVIRYVNLNPETLTGTIKIIPENPNDNEQTSKVHFKNSAKPAFVTVSGDTGNTFVMNPGRWTISIYSKYNLLMDYFVLLPEDFYMATILNQKIEEPCLVGENKLCRHYNYPNTSYFDMSLGSGGYMVYGSSSSPLTEYYKQNGHLKELGVLNKIPLLNNVQSDITYNITIRKPGRYVIVVNYLTPIDDQQTHTIHVETVAQNGKNNGRIIFYSCPYTTICRQAVTDKQSGVGVHLVDGNFISVTLQGVNANVGIHSIIAIPAEEWSLDFIKPKPVCIRKNGMCVQSTYPNPPESKKIQFEQDSVAVKNRTIYKLTNTSSYIYLDRKDGMVDLHGKVSSPGFYVFIVQYFQPDFVEFDLDIILQNGEFYEAKLPVPHCPSQSGCRALVSENNGNTRFSLTENFMISVKKPNDKAVYLDYLLIVPSDLYSFKILEEDTFDRTGEFISTCGNNHFNIDTEQEGFCRDSVFSITAAHNNGALYCQCDYDGSLSFECDKFGGQCKCKPNIIGRQCEACRNGYYGFPDCKPCHCPATAHCDTATGNCTCPSYVTGEQCDQCMQYTYGYDPIIGCEQCKCNPLGILEKNLQCNLLNGSCTCKKHVVGRQCDTCESGYFAYPHCEICECDRRGTTEDICDQESAECLCKKYVTGPTCNFCKEGNYNLESINADGCTECFCFGKTTRCMSSNFVQTSIFIMEDWSLVSINETAKLEIKPLNTSIEQVDKHVTIGIDFTFDNIKNKVVYFSAPQAYLGTKLTSYGGFLNYTIFYTIGLSGKAVVGADVILAGTESNLIHTSYEQPAAAQNYVASLQLVEYNFQLLNGLPAKREHIMIVLHNLKGIYIRAKYWSASVTTRLSHVLMDDAIPFQYYNTDGEYKFANSVEECQCPPGYDGLSCEYCAVGYYRISSGPYGGYCVPCQCNGHADECDVYTGICIGCKHNTRGNNCEDCAVGYHGNAYQGTPSDCLICACPLPVQSNNFASSCEVSADGEKISCKCNKGYYGARCQSCAAGYYGRPEDLNDYCKPCQCSGNINPNDQGSCDTVTGECLRCLNNTFGETCALCAPGYYGDAIKAKDCQPCLCDQLGTHRCNSYIGSCECRSNVIGEKCDRCKVEHYGFQSGYGCVPCNCGLASLSSQCEDATGQCMCKSGVTGRECDHCAPGYWNYSEEGCNSCGCKSEYSLGFGCNAETGRCECLPDVIGEKCDQCPDRWVFVPDVGCHVCDKCIHNLLDDTNELHELIDPHLTEFDSVDSGYFTTQRLTHINYTLYELKPRVALLDPNEINLTPILTELENLEKYSENINKKASYSTNTSKGLEVDAENIREEAFIIYDAIKEAALQAQEAIANIEYLSETLISGEGPRIDSALQEAENILEGIKLYNLTTREIETSNELTKANNLINNLQNYKKPVDKVKKDFDDLKSDLSKFSKRIDDLYNQTQYSLNKTIEADNWCGKIGKDAFIEKLKTIDLQSAEIERNLNDSKKLLNNATYYVKETQKSYTKITDDPHPIQEQNNSLNKTIEENLQHHLIIIDLVPKVEDHAANLSLQAEQIDNLFTESRNISTNAVRAATAYNYIVEAVDDATTAAELGDEAATNAAELLLEVAEDTGTSSEISNQLLGEADKANNETVEDLKPRLAGALAKSRPVRSLHEKNVEKLNNIEKFLKQPHGKSLDVQLIKAAEIATTANGLAMGIQSKTKQNFADVEEEKEASERLPNRLQDMIRGINKAQNQINTVNEQLPEIKSSLNNIPSWQERVHHLTSSLEEKIKILNQQIALARDVANRIKVGVKFFRNTTLELKNPPNLDDLSTSTYISGYFRTKERNGLILYLGNGVGTNLRRTTSDDYMALEVENGYVVLTLDVGNGPQRVVNNKFVSNNHWHQFIIDRTAHNVKLIIREEIGAGKETPHMASEKLSGPNTIFNLDKNQSKLFVGGYPAQFNIQDQVQQNSFDGEIEDLMIGEIPISLWNFKEGNENNHGAFRRDELMNLKPNTGFRFNGFGYAIIDARSYSLRSRSDIQLSFKTFDPAGLLFLIHGSTGKTFLSLELREGKIVYQYNLGSGTKLWVTSKPYNDGKWHTITASRDGAKGRFIVDKEDIPDTSNPIGGNSLESFETFFFGGYPRQHSIKEVTNVDFDGCIDDVTIMRNPVDLSYHIKAYGVTPGCPEKFARLVSFSEGNGYIKSDSFSSGDLFQMNLRFKTKSKEGLLFLATDKFMNEGVSLALVGGRLILISQKLQIETNDNTYNDNEWHVVTITHNSKTLRLDVDDYISKVTDSPPQPIRVMYGDLYFGGIPSELQIVKGLVATTVGFSGCIVDASKNGDILNFASFTNKKNEFLGKCILDEALSSETNVHIVPTLPPIKEVGYGSTKHHEMKTEEPYIAGIPQRGDGGRESRPRETTMEGNGVIAIPGTVPPVVQPLPKQPSCALPMVPAIDVMTSTKAYKYSKKKQSRSDYNLTRGKIRKQFDFTLEFKTTDTEGIILYATNPTDSHYVALFLQDGHVVFSFNGGYGAAVLRSENIYNDGNWHHVNISRVGAEGLLAIDFKIVAEGQTPKNTIMIQLYPPYYAGGIPPGRFASVFTNINTTAYFDGCINNLAMNGYAMENPANTAVLRCLELVEPGAFFGIPGGYLKLKEKFKVGLEIDIKMEIKPRNISGLLIAVHGKKDYLVLEMVNGVIKFSVDNGKGAITTSFQPDKPHYFCDGQWHNIQAVKSKNVVTLSVDSTFSDPGIGYYRSQSTDTGGALFLGGHRLLHRARGLTMRTPFIGCIKDVQINNNNINFIPEMAEGQVSVGSCPTV